MRNTVWLGVIVALLVLVGLTLFPKIDSSRNTAGIVPGIGGGPPDIKTTPFPESIKLGRDLLILIPEHGILATNYLEAIYDGIDSSDVARDLENNSGQIALIFEKIGGNREEFLGIWREHNREYEDYTKALKNSDRAGTAQAREALSNQAAQMGIYINKLLPTLSQEEIKHHMEEHIDLTLGTLEAYARDDSADRLIQMTKATSRAIEFANTLANGIEKTHIRSI